MLSPWCRRHQDAAADRAQLTRCQLSQCHCCREWQGWEQPVQGARDQDGVSPSWVQQRQQLTVVPGPGSSFKETGEGGVSMFWGGKKAR